MRILPTVVVLLMASSALSAQGNAELFRILRANDSLLFNVGFNNADTISFHELLSDNFEFYHDEAGIIPSKAALIASIRDLAKLTYRPRRQLVEGSMSVYPLKKNGQVYGAVQTGEHQFFAKEAGKPEYLTSTAKFTHLWLLENGKWKLSRVLSYDHVVPERR